MILFLADPTGGFEPGITATTTSSVFPKVWQLEEMTRGTYQVQPSRIDSSMNLSIRLHVLLFRCFFTADGDRAGFHQGHAD